MHKSTYSFDCSCKCVIRQIELQEMQSFNGSCTYGDLEQGNRSDTEVSKLRLVNRSNVTLGQPMTVLGAESRSYHWVLHGVHQADDVGSAAQVLQNLDLPLDLFFLDGLWRSEVAWSRSQPEPDMERMNERDWTGQGVSSY